MQNKKLVKDYFSFSRNERRGVIVLLILIFLFAITNRILFYFETPSRISTLLLDSLSHDLGVLNDSVSKGSEQVGLFSFDPNVIDSTTLLTLELPVKVKLNLLRFRRKGGRFNSKEDFKKIYGVSDELYGKIEPYLQINDRLFTLESTPERKYFFFDPNTINDSGFIRLGLSERQISAIRKYQKNGGRYFNNTDFLGMRCFTDAQKKILENYIKIEHVSDISADKKTLFFERIELNSADSILLKQLPGIGNKLSKRIIRYRDLLGGFFAIPQLKEVYGLDEQVILQIQDKITIDTTKIRKLDLNYCNFRELSQHPYVQKKLSKQIINYRIKYGIILNLRIMADSLKLSIDEYNRLKVYCECK